MNFGFAIALWAVVIISVLFTSVSNAEVDSSGNSILTDEADIETLLDSQTFSADQPGSLPLPIKIPSFSFQWLTTMFQILTFDVPYLKGYFEVLRLFLAGVLWWFTYRVLVDIAPVLIAIAQLFLELSQTGIGIIGSGARAFANFF